MNEKYKAQQLKSSEYYTGIIDVSFIPESEIPIELKAKKGDPIYEYRGLFGNKKVLVGEEQEDKFSISDPEDYHSYCYGETLNKIVKAGYNRMIRDGKLYRQARVKITQRNGNSETIWFNTNGDAANYLEEVKSKCSQCGNKLL